MMYLPPYVCACLERLENAGFAAYAVGGCVRDSLLGLTPHDFDLCTAATPEQMRQVFSDHRLVLAGEKHGTVTVVIDSQLVEITTFRLEGGYKDNRHPDWVKFVPTVEEDLSRRDFTVNAMAYSPSRGFADPFGGQKDLKKKILRAVGEPNLRFTEDSLRILRGLRFSVRYQLTPEAATWEAMNGLAPLMENLARERVFDELCKLLPLVNAQELQAFAPILSQVLPEIGPVINFRQNSKHHIYDLMEHTARVVEGVPPQLHLRWAALLHDIGKPGTCVIDENGEGHYHGHAKESAQMADAVLLRLKAPTALRKQVTDLISRHMTPLEPDKHLLRRRLGKYGVQETLDLLELQKADYFATGTKSVPGPFPEISRLIDEILEEAACFSIRDLAVNGNDLQAIGFAPGPNLGKCLETLLRLVQEDALPNEKSALLEKAEELESLL